MSAIPPKADNAERDGMSVDLRFDSIFSIERARARVVVHRIIAAGDYVWAHVNFLNLFNDDPDDTGIAGVDIYKFDAAGKAIEHWDTCNLLATRKMRCRWSRRIFHAPTGTECSELEDLR
jgi:predicted SnoaL-like aldol condensation-catalyzing enzyme